VSLKYHTIAVFLVIGLACCSMGNKGESTHAFQLYEDNGITIAETTGGPQYLGEVLTYTLILEMKEDPDNTDSFMEDLVRPFYGPNGHYYFLDSNASPEISEDHYQIVPSGG